MYVEILVRNDEEGRPATPSEIEELIASEMLFINYYTHIDSDEARGKVFIDLDCNTDGFSLHSDV